MPLIHFGLTSWDVNNLAYALMLGDARDRLAVIADRLIEKLDALAAECADAALLGRTHAQPASPTTMGKEIAVFAHRLRRQRDAIAEHVFDGKCNGAVGNYNALVAAWPRINWPQVARRMIEKMGLRFASHTTQIEPYDGMVEFFDALARTNRILCDLARDASVYIGAGHLRLPAKPGEVGSSTMPHKINPIDFENGEGNIAVANALLTMFAEQLQQSRLQARSERFDHPAQHRRRDRAHGGCLDLDRARPGGHRLRSGEHGGRARRQLAGARRGSPDRAAPDGKRRRPTRSSRRATRRGGRLDRAAYRKLIEKTFPPGSPEQRQLLRLRPEKYTGLAARLARKKAG